LAAWPPQPPTGGRWQVAGGLPSRGQGRCTVCDSNYKTMWMYWVGKVLEVLNVRLEILNRLIKIELGLHSGNRHAQGADSALPHQFHFCGLFYFPRGQRGGGEEQCYTYRCWEAPGRPWKPQSAAPPVQHHFPIALTTHHVTCQTYQSC